MDAADGLSAQRRTPRVYTAEEKAEFFRLLEEQGNGSAVARQLGFVRVTCYKWAHQAGIFTGPNVDAKRHEFLRLRQLGLSRAEAAKQADVDKRTAQDFDKGIRQFSGGRLHADGTVVTYNAAEKLAAVKRPRTTYLTVPGVDVDRAGAKDRSPVSQPRRPRTNPRSSPCWPVDPGHFPGPGASAVDHQP